MSVSSFTAFRCSNLGETCDGSKKMLYPIHRTGVGACTDRCPTAESAESVNGHDPQDKSKMVCMSKEDFASTQFTKASEAGKIVTGGFARNDSAWVMTKSSKLLILCSNTRPSLVSRQDRLEYSDAH